MRKVRDIPFVFLTAAGSFIIFAAIVLCGGYFLLGIHNWWLLVAAPALAVFFTTIAAVIRLRGLGLATSTTMGELNDTLARNKRGRK